MLGNAIALLTLATMFAFEGRRTEGAPRVTFYTMATILALCAAALNPITARLPTVGTTLSSIFGSPVAWFVLLMGLFLVARPLWAKGPGAVTAANAPDYPFLSRRAAALARHVEQYRATRPIFRSDLPDITQAVIDGTSTLVLFENAGFVVPSLPGPHSENVAVGMQYYFSRMHPFLRDGLIDEARIQSTAVAEAADRFAANFNLQQEFWTSGW